MDQIKLFNTVRKGIENKGKDFCSICYFITQSSVPPPLAYTDLCRHIDAKL